MPDQRSTAEERELSSSGAKVSLKINDIAVEPTNIVSLMVREWTFDHSRIPRLELIIKDDGMFVDVNIPSQGKIVDVDIIKDKDDSVEPDPTISLTGQYKIIDFDIRKSNDQQAGSASEILISAVLDVADYFSHRPTGATPDTDSKGMLETVATDLGCTFSSNINSTADTMTWLSIGQTNSSFIQHVASRSFLGSSDATLCYIDKDKQMNYNSIITAMSGEAKSAKFDLEMATQDTKRSLITVGAKKGLEEQESTETLWYSSITLKNSSNSSALINNGFKTTARVVDLKVGTYKMGTGSDVPPPNQTVTDTVLDSHSSLLSTDEDPNSTSFNREVFTYKGILNGARASADNIYSDDYYNSMESRKNVLAELLGMPILIEVNPNIPVANFELLDVEVPTAVKQEEFDSSEVFDGKYLVLGVLYFLDNGYFKKILSIHRVGFNSYQGDL